MTIGAYCVIVDGVTRRQAAPDPEFELAKRSSAFHLLMRVGRLINEQALQAARQRFGFDVRVSHLSLLPHISWEGSRQTELAGKLGISKQAVNQLVGELVEVGLLERRPDPSDGRAMLVGFSARGRRSLSEGLGVLVSLEREAETVVGQPCLANLHRSLSELDRWLAEREQA